MHCRFRALNRITSKIWPRILQQIPQLEFEFEFQVQNSFTLVSNCQILFFQEVMQKNFDIVFQKRDFPILKLSGNLIKLDPKTMQKVVLEKNVPQELRQRLEDGFLICIYRLFPTKNIVSVRNCQKSNIPKFQQILKV